MGVKGCQCTRGQEHLWRCGTWDPWVMHVSESCQESRQSVADLRFTYFMYTSDAEIR